MASSKLVALVVMACASTGLHAARASDLRDFALSACLIKQQISSPLQEEGYRLAEIVIHRAGITPFTWTSLNDAVVAEVARRSMLTTHVDAPVAESDRPVPLAHCLAVIDAPGVKTAMANCSQARTHDADFRHPDRPVSRAFR